MKIDPNRPSTIARRKIAFDTLYKFLIERHDSPVYYPAIGVAARVADELTVEIASGDLELSDEELEKEKRRRTLRAVMHTLLTPAEAADWQYRADDWAGAKMRHDVTGGDWHPYTISAREVEELFA